MILKFPRGTPDEVGEGREVKESGMAHDLNTAAREGAQRLHAAMAKAGHPERRDEQSIRARSDG